MYCCFMKTRKTLPLEIKMTSQTKKYDYHFCRRRVFKKFEALPIPIFHVFYQLS